MSQEKLLAKMNELSLAEEGVSLFSGSPAEVVKREARLNQKVRREFPELFQSDPDSAAAAVVNKNATGKANEFERPIRDLFGASRQLFGCVNRGETAFVFGAKIPKQEPAGHEKISFAISGKPIKMPILPATPGRSVDGREISDEFLRDILRYDPKKRRAVVKKIESDGHDQTNVPALGVIERVYDAGNGWIYADVYATRGNELLLAEIVGPDGAYGHRSIEADKLDGFDGYWLESVALLGGQRPALSLPDVEFTTSSTKQIYRISGESLR